MRVICTKPFLPVVVECLEKMLYSSHSLFNLSFVLACIEESLNLASLCQSLPAGDIITFELVKGLRVWHIFLFRSSWSIVLYMGSRSRVLCVGFASVLKSLSLAVKAISLILYLLLWVTSEVPIVMSLGMQTLLSEIFVIIKGSALLCNVSLLMSVE